MFLTWEAEGHYRKTTFHSLLTQEDEDVRSERQESNIEIEDHVREDNAQIDLEDNVQSDFDEYYMDNEEPEMYRKRRFIPNYILSITWKSNARPSYHNPWGKSNSE